MKSLVFRTVSDTSNCYFGGHRIRHYGLFANSSRANNIALARRLLGGPDTSASSEDSDGTENPHQDSEWNACPCCGGRMIIIEPSNPAPSRGSGPSHRSGSTAHDHHTPGALPHPPFRATPSSHRRPPRFPAT